MQAKNSSHFSVWVSCLQEHQQMRQALLVGGVTTEPLLSPLLSSTQSALEEWRAENNTKLADVRTGQQHVYHLFTTYENEFQLHCLFVKLFFVGLKALLRSRFFYSIHYRVISCSREPQCHDSTCSLTSSFLFVYFKLLFHI